MGTRQSLNVLGTRCSFTMQRVYGFSLAAAALEGLFEHPGWGTERIVTSLTLLLSERQRGYQKAC